VSPSDDVGTNLRTTSGEPPWLRRIAAFNGAVAVLLFTALTIVVALQILTRFVLHRPFIWSEELARFLFFWVVLLGAAIGVKRRRHFVLDVTGGLRGRLRRLGRFLFDALPDACVLCFSLFLLVQGIGYTRVGMFRVATNSGLSMGLVYLAIPVSAALSVVYAAANLVRDAASAVRGSAASPTEPPSAE
jgi:TRAP-type C4-dicarboxylate transport system permease small subunit